MARRWYALLILRSLPSAELTSPHTATDMHADEHLDEEEHHNSHSHLEEDELAAEQKEELPAAPAGKSHRLVPSVRVSLTNMLTLCRHPWSKPLYRRRVH